MQDGTENVLSGEGALKLLYELQAGIMKVNESYRAGSLPEIMAYTHRKEEKTLIKSQDTQNVIGYISRFHIGNQLICILMMNRGMAQDIPFCL